jgi:hypothetical protein
MVNLLILALIGILGYMVLRRPATGETPTSKEPSVVTTTRDTNPDTTGKTNAYDGDGNPVTVDPVSRDYIPPAKPAPSDQTPSVPRSTVPETPTGIGEIEPRLLPERIPAAPTGEGAPRPGLEPGLQVFTVSSLTAYRAEKEGIRVYEPDKYSGMRSFFLSNHPGSWQHGPGSEETKKIYAEMYGTGYLAKLEQIGKVAENTDPSVVVPHRTIRPPDRRAQHFIYDGLGNEVIWDEHERKVFYPAA